MKRNHLIALLVASMLLSTACGSTQAETEPETQPVSTETITETETERPYYDTQGIDYGGYSFGIWDYDNINVNLWTGIPYDMFVEDLNGDILNDAVYTRNLTIEEKLNITINGSVVTDDYINALNNMISAGEYGLDLMHTPLVHVGSIVNRNAIYDAMKIAAFDFSEPWWNQNCNKTMTMKNKLFTLASDASYFDKLSTIVVFFNQELVNNHNMGDMYSIVEEGKWTLDKAVELGEYVTADLDGNSQYDQHDAVGISCQNDGSYYLMHGFGVQVCTTDDAGNLSLDLGSERAMDALQSVYELMGDPSIYFNRQTFNLTLIEAINLFIEERSLFMIRPLQSLYRMREMNADFGIIPLPKYDETQSAYHSAVNTYSGTIGMIPHTSEDPERTGVILSALACESHYTVIEQLYETVLGEKLIRDESSRHMLDYAFAGTVYDPGLIWNFGEIQSTLLNNKKTDIASMLASVEKKVTKAIDTFNTFLDEVE